MRNQWFNTFWHGGDLGPLEWACLSSFVEHGHKLRLFSYDPILVPAGVSHEDASVIMPRDTLFSVDGSVAAFSDLFRYQVILKCGEWWCDTDVYCISDEIPYCQYAWAHQDCDTINGALLKFPAHDPALQTIADAANQIGNTSTIWCELGPTLLTKHLSEAAYPFHLGQRRLFYPIHWLESFFFWLPGMHATVMKRSEDALFIHLWTSTFPRMGIDTRMQPPERSFLDAIYTKHCKHFELKKIEPSTYKRLLEGISAYLHNDWVPTCSALNLNYDISKFDFAPYFDCQSAPSELYRGAVPKRQFNLPAETTAATVTKDQLLEKISQLRTAL